MHFLSFSCDWLGCRSPSLAASLQLLHVRCIPHGIWQQGSPEWCRFRFLFCFFVVPFFVPFFGSFFCSFFCSFLFFIPFCSLNLKSLLILFVFFVVPSFLFYLSVFFSFVFLFSPFFSFFSFLFLVVFFVFCRCFSFSSPDKHKSGGRHRLRDPFCEIRSGQGATKSLGNSPKSLLTFSSLIMRISGCASRVRVERLLAKSVRTGESLKETSGEFFGTVPETCWRPFLESFWKFRAPKIQNHHYQS